MTHEAFQAQMSRLSETFGKIAYGNERVRLIWRAVQPFSNEWMADAVDYFIGNLRHAPLMPEFSEKISIERERNWSRQKETAPDALWSPTFACGDCRDGVWLAKKDAHSGIWAFRCRCPKGEADPRKMIPQFKQAHVDEGFYFYEVRR